MSGSARIFGWSYWFGFGCCVLVHVFTGAAWWQFPVAFVVYTTAFLVFCRVWPRAPSPYTHPVGGGLLVQERDQDALKGTMAEAVVEAYTDLWRQERRLSPIVELDLSPGEGESTGWPVHGARATWPVLRWWRRPRLTVRMQDAETPTALVGGLGAMWARAHGKSLDSDEAREASLAIMRALEQRTMQDSLLAFDPKRPWIQVYGGPVGEA